MNTRFDSALTMPSSLTFLTRYILVGNLSVMQFSHALEKNLVIESTVRLISSILVLLLFSSLRKLRIENKIYICDFKVVVRIIK